MLIQWSRRSSLQDINTSFKDKAIELYSQILKYQIQPAQQYSRLGLFRFLRDVVVADDWKVRVADLKKTEKRITKDLSTFDTYTLKSD